MSTLSSKLPCKDVFFINRPVEGAFVSLVVTVFSPGILYNRTKVVVTNDSVDMVEVNTVGISHKPQDPPSVQVIPEGREDKWYFEINTSIEVDAFIQVLSDWNYFPNRDKDKQQ